MVSLSHLDTFRARIARAMPGVDIGELHLIDTVFVREPEIDEAEREIKGTVSTTGAALDEMVFIPHQFDYSYFPKKVNTVYLNHDYDCRNTGGVPVAICRKLQRKGDGSMYASTVINRGGMGDDILSAVRFGAIKGKSIGIRIKDCGPATEDEMYEYPAAKKASAVVRSATVLEYSLVAMPADPQALIDLVSRGTIRRASAVAMGLQDSPVRRVYPTHGMARVYRATA